MTQTYDALRRDPSSLASQVGEEGFVEKYHSGSRFELLATLKVREGNMPDQKWKAPIDITKEQWMSLLRDEKTITEKDLRLLKAIYRYFVDKGQAEL